MSNQRITFNPSSGTPYGVNLSLFAGSDFEVNFTTVDQYGSAFDFSNWSGSSQMTKSVSIGSSMYAHGTFDFSFVSASNGQFKMYKDDGSGGKTLLGTITESTYVGKDIYFAHTGSIASGGCSGFFNFGQDIDFIAWINSFRRITCIKILVKSES